MSEKILGAIGDVYLTTSPSVAWVGEEVFRLYTPHSMPDVYTEINSAINAFGSAVLHHAQTDLPEADQSLPMNVRLSREEIAAKESFTRAEIKEVLSAAFLAVRCVVKSGLLPDDNSGQRSTTARLLSIYHIAEDLGIDHHTL